MLAALGGIETFIAPEQLMASYCCGFAIGGRCARCAWHILAIIFRGMGLRGLDREISAAVILRRAVEWSKLYSIAAVAVRRLGSTEERDDGTPLYCRHQIQRAMTDLFDQDASRYSREISTTSSPSGS